MGDQSISRPLLIRDNINREETGTDVNRTPCMGDRPVSKPLPADYSINTDETRADILDSNRIRTHDPSV
jgi:hypothetical protein